MKLIKPRAYFLGEVPVEREFVLPFIEAAGRTCYKSEDKICEGSAAKFVGVLIRAGHLAMVEHSNFVVRAKRSSESLATVLPLAGKFLDVVVRDGVVYVGGNLTAWAERCRWCRESKVFGPLFGPFKRTYGDLFGEEGAACGEWEVCPAAEVPDELRRYTAKLICDRGVTHEVARHRPCSFAQESTRYVRYENDNMQFVEPCGFRNWTHQQKTLFRLACGHSGLVYRMMRRLGLRPEQARAALNNAVKTEIVITADAAEWKHIFKLRCAADAHPDMRRVMMILQEQMGEAGVV